MYTCNFLDYLYYYSHQYSLIKILVYTNKVIFHTWYDVIGWKYVKNINTLSIWWLIAHMLMSNKELSLLFLFFIYFYFFTAMLSFPTITIVSKSTLPNIQRNCTNSWLPYSAKCNSSQQFWLSTISYKVLCADFCRKF